VVFCFYGETDHATILAIEHDQRVGFKKLWLESDSTLVCQDFSSAAEVFIALLERSGEGVCSYVLVWVSKFLIFLKDIIVLINWLTWLTRLYVVFLFIRWVLVWFPHVLYSFLFSFMLCFMLWQMIDGF